jgi:hypothetical protein
MHQVGFEPTIPASARPQTHALDRTATGIGQGNQYQLNWSKWNWTEFQRLKYDTFEFFLLVYEVSLGTQGVTSQ